MPVLTLTTDFGIKDGFVGTMKGVILGICPGAQLVDLTHTITPQNILEGAFALWRAYSFFPPGTVHLAVVDPGVGTQRRPLAARIGEHFFVGPDNGLFTPIYEDAHRNNWNVEIIHLTNEKYWLPAISQTFHGRDIFSPVAAHLANGIPLSDLGLAIQNPIRIQLPKPEKTANGWIAHVTVVDVFGNCTTDLPAKEVIGSKDISFQVHGQTIHGLVDSYGHKEPGELVALVDSESFIEIAVVNGSAAQILGLKVGDVVEVFVS
jgi:hypothetical protein